ncbi:peptidylprolyl isomerase [candidate division KSB1 bacterium]|nr:peptidylprolyl isomerase [candidate division KSB1 bacterium]
MRVFPKAFILLTVIVFAACGSDDDTATFQKGSEIYDLALALSDSLPLLNPDKNNVWISTSDFDIRTASILDHMNGTYGLNVDMMKNMSGVKLKNIFTETAAEVGENRLILEAARRDRIVIDESRVDTAYQNLAKRHGGIEKYEAGLAQSYRTPRSVRKQLRDNLLREKYLELTLGEKIKIAEGEIIAAYAEVKFADVRQIFFRSSHREIANEVLKKIANGQDFDKLIDRYSEEEATNKGKRYRIVKGDTARAEALHDAAFSLQPGEVSGIIKSSLGLHIIKVESHLEDGRQLSDVREELKAIIRERKFEQAYAVFLDSLKKATDYKVIIQ